MFDDQQDSAEKKHKEKKHEKAVPLVHHRISFQSAQHSKSVCVCVLSFQTDSGRWIE